MPGKGREGEGKGGRRGRKKSENTSIPAYASGTLYVQIGF